MEEQFEIIGIDYDSQIKGRRQTEIRALSKTEFKNGLDSFLQSFSDVLTNCKKKVGDFELDEIELKVEVSLTGSIRLIGSVETSTTGGMTLKLKRKGKSKPEEK